MIKIVTDSSAGLPEDLVTGHDIRLVTAVLDFGGQPIREHADLTVEQLNVYLAEDPPAMPQPASPSWRDFMVVYDQLIADAPDATIFSIHVAALLSGTLAAAQRAADQYAGMDIRLIDSASCLLGEGLLVLAAARLVAAGGPADAVQAHLADQRAHQRLACLVDTAVAGGRTWASPGGPPFALLALQEGVFTVHSRHASRSAALDALRALARTAQPGSPLGIMHADCPADAAALSADLAAACHPDPLLTAPIGPAFGVVLGLGALVVAWSVPPG